MDVRAGGAAGGTGVGNDVTHPYALARVGNQLAVVRVARHVTVAVVDLDDVAIAAADAGEGDHAFGHRMHRRAQRGGDVDAGMPRGVAAERVGTTTEIGRDITLHR